jgi:hypothetical protein
LKRGDTVGWNETRGVGLNATAKPNKCFEYASLRQNKLLPRGSADRPSRAEAPLAQGTRAVRSSHGAVHSAAERVCVVKSSLRTRTQQKKPYLVLPRAGALPPRGACRRSRCCFALQPLPLGRLCPHVLNLDLIPLCVQEPSCNVPQPGTLHDRRTRCIGDRCRSPHSASQPVRKQLGDMGQRTRCAAPWERRC